MAVPATIAERAHEARFPRIVVALAHPTMRRYVCDLIEQGCRCWLATTPPEWGPLIETVEALRPDVIVADAAAFSAAVGSTALLPAYPMLVIGSEPDGPYREAAVRAGARGWVGGDRLHRQLLPALGQILEASGCSCRPPRDVEAIRHSSRQARPASPPSEVDR